MKQDKVKDIMAQAKAFPGMPDTAAKLIKLLENPDSSGSQIEEILKYDAGLTANILKLANSAYFGIPCRVGSVKQAIVLLGWKRLFQLVMTMCMSSVMKKPVAGYDLPRGELWRHSIAVSVAAELVVKALKIPNAEDVFTAALLHDVGKLLLGDYIQDDLQQIETMVSKGITFDVAEYFVLGTDHAEVGAQVLENWGFPMDLVKAVNWHHDPDTCKNHCTLSDIVHVANALGLKIGSAKDKEGSPVEASRRVMDRLGLKPAHIEALAEQTLEGVDKLSDMVMSG